MSFCELTVTVNTNNDNLFNLGSGKVQTGAEKKSHAYLHSVHKYVADMKYCYCSLFLH